MGHQVVNLRSNIGADDLSEIRRFAEFASAFPEQQMTKSLVFLLRDAPNYNISGEEFIENIWRRCSTSADLSEITQMISNRFQHIGCICAPAPSHELRIASGAFRVTESDWPLLNAFEELKRKVIDQISTYGSHHPVTIDYCKKAAQFFVHEAPRITTSVQVMTEARMVQAVRHALDLYSDELKKAQFENLEIIHEEAKRRGLHTFQSQDATIENIEQMKERFLSGIEGSYQEVPRIDQLEGYVFSKLKKISKEIELVGRVVAFTSDFVNIIRTRAENRFREAIRESHGVLVKSWERREQFEKQRVANEQMLADLEQQEAQRKAYLSEQERQNAAIEEAERRERSSSRNLIEFDPFPKVDANQREQEEKEKEIQRQQQQFDHKWLLEKNHEMERKVEEEKQRLQKAEKELRLRQMQDDLIRRDNEARERKEREAIDRRWQNEQRQKNREIENDIERRKFEENQILEGWQSELQAANLERQRKADSRQQQMSDAEKMMLQPTPAPPLTREQKNKVEIDKRIQQFQGMLQDMVAQSQLDHPFTKEKASVLWRQLEILLENELAELRNTFYGDFSYARETQMKDLLNGEYSKVVGHADDESFECLQAEVCTEEKNTREKGWVSAAWNSICFRVRQKRRQGT
ncbi:unnamed protein product, partial [Mesorhabditis belari]|uniref:Uncharacterized protein n=1 Tax=Mesorhabditis belari TaxID=2138241 RepID=A0AAF3J7J4_9BILA